ncbi:[NiFe] hydrogenase metallocenter assembly protein HypE [[Actinomadura] parvosata subsp. kistnae]|uniref:Hydrogenase expression/formation protein HypE n=1 Tax=[Actinomadura] parvosata subsp. kistnae TaxID=1909395 RepID=A0A1U9ZZ67_9ACTN|nr:hydrogenase expression/formation protein HypE [Nonomuraea sp. ATCC 55076]AQZ63248.1 hydrogenase expression/formation protein HypE [Nonomuraea sp. ATCC 55076]SPL98928.1 [NiFe] hydrogenase metallocenter assembly protein HypE [Actinomadura parvosata subsp. kistnae]
MTTRFDPIAATCPAPQAETERVLLGHGSGGQLMAELLADLTPRLGAGTLEDAAIVTTGTPEIVLSTDGFVVTPRFFPGGDIGSLAVHGTVNDLAMMGAVPVALSLAYIVEEGLPLDELRRVTTSVAEAARACDVRIVTGDTKVVGKGAADGLFVTTTGIGVRLPGAHVAAANGRPGDAVLLSGPIGLHGITILSTREGLGFESSLASDSRPLHRLTTAMITAGACGVHTLRDPTRGGLASALNELAAASGVAVELDEPAVPVPAQVAAACDLLGLDPLHVANEGCLVAFVDPARAEAVLAAMRARPEGACATRIGTVVAGPSGRVTMRTLVGSRRVIDMLVGEQLPRIC